MTEIPFNSVISKSLHDKLGSECDEILKYYNIEIWN